MIQAAVKVDIDECEESNGGCSQLCNNLPGEFVCSCKSGYEIDESDGKTCLDINECKDSALSWDCEGGCENLIGSYRCLPSTEGILVAPNQTLPEDNGVFSGTIVCKPGFEQSADGSECKDINECELKDKDPKTGRITQRYCEHIYENTKGSFRCHCPEGYNLLEDKQSCAMDGLPSSPKNNTIKDVDKTPIVETPCGKSCKVVKRCQHPPNGKVQCSAHPHKLSFKWNCLTTCNPGYVLQGPEHSTCYPSGRWEGAEPNCHPESRTEIITLSCSKTCPQVSYNTASLH
uniref:Signal peptide, CUB and EGF-like domain-containing protein 2 n=1 Tax=Drosophila rhopaloa TaxID=1041015 RepID=A0A6P4E658_DRORH